MGIGGQRVKRWGSIGACVVVVVAATVVLGGAAHGAVAFRDADFGGYASGTAVHVAAVQAGAPGPREPGRLDDRPGGRRRRPGRHRSAGS